MDSRTFRGGPASSLPWLRLCLCFSGSPFAHFPKTPGLCPPSFLVHLPVQFCAVGAKWGRRGGSPTQPSVLGGCGAAERGALAATPGNCRQNKWYGKGVEADGASSLQPSVRSCSQHWRGRPASTSFVLQGTAPLGFIWNQPVKR